MNIMNILIVVIIVLAIIIVKAYRKYVLIDKINRYEGLRKFLIYNMGIIRAENFSYVRLEKIYTQVKSIRDSLKNNPHIIYDIVTNTEDDLEKYLN